MDDGWEDSESGEEYKSATLKIRCLAPDFNNQRYQDDGYETATSVEQVWMKQLNYKIFPSIYSGLFVA